MVRDGSRRHRKNRITFCLRRRESIAVVEKSETGLEELILLRLCILKIQILSNMD